MDNSFNDFICSGVERIDGRVFRLGLETIYCTAKRNETAPRNHT